MSEGGNARKNLAPLVLAAAFVAVLVAITLFVKRPDDSASMQGQASTSAAPLAEDSGPIAKRSPSLPRTSEGMSAAEVAERLKKNLEQRNKLRQDQIAKTTVAKQRAIETYRNERVDPAWAPQQENRLGEIAASPAIAQTKIAPRSLTVDCKSTMCLVNGTFANNGEAEDWLLMYMSSVGSNLPNSIVSRIQNPDGTTSVEIYGKGR